MKNLIILLTIFWITTAYSFGQTTEKFDILTFQTPKGWQKEIGKNTAQFGIEDSTGGICLITILKPLPATEDPKANFEAAWDSLVKEMVTVKTKVEMQPPNSENGWTAESGYAQYESDGKKGLVMLVTISGGGKMVSIMILTNTDTYQAEISSFLDSVKLPKVEDAQTNSNSQTVQAVNDGYTYSTITFNDGWTSTVQNDWVAVTKGQLKLYIFYALPYNASDFSGTGVRERDYYWDNYVGKYFAIQSKQYQDNGESIGSFQPNYVEGWATDRQTGEKRFVAMTLSIVPNTVYVTIASAPNEASFRQQFPKANDKYSSDLTNMRGYNKFAISANDIIGRWTDGNTSTAHWYYVTPSGYESYAGMTIASTSAGFNFGNGGTYTSEHSGTTGSVGNLSSFKQNYKGNYKVTNWNITATNRWQGKTENFEAWFEVVRGGRILKLKTGGMSYNLVRVK